MATRNDNTDGNGGLPQAVVEELLSAEHRRLALSVLRDRGEPTVVQDLAAAVVAASENRDLSDVSTAERAAMAGELYTEHIPKLTATGVLSYDSITDSVELERGDLVRAVES